MSSASRSRTAFWYSVRFRRRNVAVRPGSGSAAAARSSAVSMRSRTRAYVVASGRGRGRGGIAPARSLRTTFSHTSPCAGTSRTSTRSSDSPPVSSRSLWQVTQYRSMTAWSADALSPDAASCGAAPAGAAHTAPARTHTDAAEPNSDQRIGAICLRGLDTALGGILPRESCLSATSDSRHRRRRMLFRVRPGTDCPCGHSTASGGGRQMHSTRHDRPTAAEPPRRPCEIGLVPGHYDHGHDHGMIGFGPPGRTP